jgi:hypothetical protein
MSAPTTCDDAPTAEDFLEEAAARLDRLAQRGMTPGSDIYELWRVLAQLTAALRAMAGPPTAAEA